MVILLKYLTMQRSMNIPETFIKYVYVERKELVEKMITERATREDFLVGFTRHTPVIITYGPAGLNGSVKGVGFLLRTNLLERAIGEFKKFLKEKSSNMKSAISLLMKYIYPDDYENKIDFSKFITLELARKHTFINLQYSNNATLLFYTPPDISYEVRCKTEVHINDKIWEYANLVHDVFHLVPYHERERDWLKTPAYLFKITEIYDNSPEKMGVKIYP